MQTTKPQTAKDIRPEERGLRILLEGKDVVVPWERIPGPLATATPEQRCNAELSPGGYGIHWPQLDEDLTIGGLLRMAGDD